MMYYNTTNSHTLHTALRRAVMMVVCALATLLTMPTTAQVVIGGDVYGGGKMGAVNNGTSTATSVTIKSGSVRTVFGGGQEGEVKGSTTVSINGGTIGAEALEGTPYGGVYGGGEGADATVTGSTSVTINGGDNFNNVYGGGKQALLTGNAHVSLIGGQVRNNVFAGACMANIEGYALVDIIGGGSNQLIIKAVYGGNDISGSITGGVSPANVISPTTGSEYNFKVTGDLPTTLESFVFAQSTATNAFIGNVFGGGNGAYNYRGSEGSWSVTMNDPEAVSGTITFGNLPNKPVAPRAYLQIEGGTYGNIYGGGNKATISERTDIYFGIGMTGDSYADVTPLSNIPAAALDWLDLYEGYTVNNNETPDNPADDSFSMLYNAYRIFGGNNIADMAIRPHWHLKSGMVGNIYSGGNQGRMTYAQGLFLPLTSNFIKVNNVYGGCRMADVNPGDKNGAGTLANAETFDGYTFAAGYATRVYITGGKINNVYGGNDISGKVYYGTNVEIHGAISGDVYGGGNGSYAYTDNEAWVTKHPEDADYYYNPGTNSLDALYNKRPHVEKTLVHITGTEANPVIVAGNVYCGGNSATLDKDGNQAGATATFQIGKYVSMNGVFLGSNGENMIKEEILEKYANDDFSSLDLTNSNQFRQYMQGVAVNIYPEIIWDENLEYQTKIGSFYCGGNVGSMTYDGLKPLELPAGICIFDKVVAGCNSANIAARSSYNAAYEGGLTGSNEDGLKVKMTVRSRLEPGKLTIVKDGLFLKSANYALKTATVKMEDENGAPTDKVIYLGANVYGGCYNSGYINGGVEINIEDDLISPSVDNAILKNTGDYVYASAMAIYGGGYGTGTEIRGNTKLNFSDKARVLLAFGGGQMGKIIGDAEVKFDEKLALPGAEKDNINVHRAYAGGYAGEITGNTTLNLFGGGVMRAFAGACNANIGGYTTAIVGSQNNEGKGLPYVAGDVIGGNDFGGQIIGNCLREIPVNNSNTTKKVRSQTYVQYLSGDIADAIYGGSYGSYKYTESSIYTQEPISSPTFLNVPTKEKNDEFVTNTFVDIASQSNSERDIIGSNANSNAMAAGGGRGYANLPDAVKVAQTYVLLHADNTTSGRTAAIAHRIYGGGNLSTVVNTQVDAYSGNVDMIFGGTQGVKTLTSNDMAPYNVEETVINTYDGMDYATMDIFGAGANSGADVATINLYGGTMKDVHGGAYTEGYTPETHINVLDGSTAQVNAIYGGGYGEEEGRPCDVGESNITFASASAKVEDAIYGGNHTARVTTKTNIAISVPVKNYIGELRDIYGAGYGEETVSGFTLVDLQEGAQVANVFGGGRDGKVYNHYSYYGNTTEGSDAVVAYYRKAPHRHGNWTNAAIQPGTTSPISTDIMTNTLVLIRQGAIVNENVYGGGFGTTAHVSGESYVNLLGGSVKGDIYGGGYAGAMPRMTNATKGYINDELTNQTITTLCAINGGEVRNVFGGGYQGDIEGNTHVTIGISGSEDPYNGKPAILRSVYGGGEMAEVTQTSKVDMYNGYVGYYYDSKTNKFVKNLDLRKAGDKLLKGNGNLFGAGYGVGAVVMYTQVNLWDGVIRNSLYGGAEIATVGRGSVKLENEKYVLDEFTAGGKTQVRMYGGKVEGDVFGGGRGFSYDLSGNVIEDIVYYTSGYVFGQTDVEIYRGTIGTTESLEDGQGNVFGGGNIGYVYGGSAAGQSVKYTGETVATNAVFKGHYYYQKDGLSENEKIQETDDINNTTGSRTEDCRVHIEAWCQATAEVTINGTTYQAGEYVSTAALNTLTATHEAWDKLDKTGITIRNAVFAGGNVSSGSDKIYANAVTVYGNATAAVVDVFSKDFITVGGDGVGGLYGDGNLTFVDGYRELNISNYGTDFYNLDADLTYDEYLLLSDREKGFYDLRYSPKDGETINFDFDGVTYIYYSKKDETPANEIDEHEFKAMLNAHIQKYALEMVGKWTSTTDAETKVITYKPNSRVEFTLGGVTYVFSTENTYSATQYDEMMANYKLYQKKLMENLWNINGECSLTAGRMLNTIQRADFCGMFGSRIMLYGAQDRVPEIVDYTKYTINRVGEVSLNQRKAPYNATEIHGNYFGIYNVVNLLGALTSDVEFTDVREDEGILEDNLQADGKTMYIEFKYDKLSNDPRARNMASSKNMVAQASGVFLELVQEKDEQGNKTYGPVTGVIQLDLINVKPGEGGGYVYAQNQHGTPVKVNESVKSRQVLSEANAGAYSYANYTYNSTLQPLQTSGNFVHPTKRIVDDCFPRGGYYNEEEDNYSHAHMWYIRGDFYVYDQYVSGYTGAAQAYEQNIDIPLTIAAGSEGRMTLQSVNPSKYAYFIGKHYGDKVLGANDSILVEETTYHLNDPISYWDWSQLSITDQSYFVDETYVAICDAKINDTEYEKGHVLLPEDYSNLVETSQNKAYIKDIHGNYHTDNDDYIEQTDYVFRISNEISHDAGYLITFDITNPLEWDNYYTKLNKGDGNIEKMLESVYLAGVQAGNIIASDYTAAPTLLCTKSGIYGQRDYEVDNLVNEAVFLSQNSISNSSDKNVQAAYGAIAGVQAAFAPAYVVTADELTFNYSGTEYHMFKGGYISKTMYDGLDDALKTTANFEPAYICINTIEVADKEYVLNGELIPQSRYNELKGQAQVPEYTFMYGKADTNGELSRYFSPAYICTKEGKYGGNYFEEKKNYRALDFCGLPRDERNAVNTDQSNVFQFNFDAFNLLATDFDPNIRKYQEPYWNTQAVNYTATYAGEESATLYMRTGPSDTYDGSLGKAITINKGKTYQRAEYESILNEKAHYMPIKVDDVGVPYYVVNETFEKANVYYPVGKVISEEDYNMLSEILKGKVTVLAKNTFSTTGTYYYCTEAYNRSSMDGSQISDSYSTVGATVPQGTIITKADYDDLPNYQNGFIIQGHAPIQTTTIYVPRESDINNLSQDRVITVVYRYDYKEGSGADVTQYSEKHIINIHLEFRSGQPSIGDVTPPATVLPNSTVGLSVPSVKKGAYEILGGGWEIFETPEDAYEHKNGVAYKNNATPMYWYQNNYYVAYYAKTYLGKTYSNPVPFSVANYHRLGEVMNHDQRMFIDHKDVDRASKIYLDAASYDPNSIAADFDENDPLVSPNGKRDGKNDLDYLYDLYQETKNGQTLVVDPAIPYVFNTRIKNAANLEFILRSDIAPKKYAVSTERPEGWLSVGDSENCFAGILHGNGYTISGLDKSLFNYLCGNVYNLGVTGSFTGGGIADHNGYAENCWVYTTGAPTTQTQAVIGDGGTIVNSYYREDNAFTEGQAIKKTKSEFEQGEVTYLLNRFHLHKRYSDHSESIKNANENPEYTYYELNTGTNELTLKNSRYETSHATHAYSGVNRGYVEDYYIDGDFIYANGEIPLENNERLDVESGMHYPIYPDDYIFFGQRLSYEPETHHHWPVHIQKRTDGENRERIERVMENANRVYRAPAYYKSKTMDKVYFNIFAAFVDNYVDNEGNTVLVDHDMTAIDFTGYNDNSYDANYKPYLDYEGLNGIRLSGLTPNLLIYADPADASSYQKVSASLNEPKFAFDNVKYYSVAPVLDAKLPRGHLVGKNGNNYLATSDHFLVDKQNFNVPIAYTFDNNHGMWYQRTPDRFANRDNKGWDVVCLPFTADIVTTHQKGEITHFYGDDDTMHEYWLRELQNVTKDTETKAGFARPDDVSDGPTLVVENTFLYDYYYHQQDANRDDYQSAYYASDRNYPNYAYLTAAKPYIVAFPGETYYEFDMSGQFEPEPEHTGATIENLDLQVVTMASAMGVSIAVTDDENRKSEAFNDYQFVGSYQQELLSTQHYLIDTEDASFDAVTQDAINNGSALSVPFRGYFVGPSTRAARIYIGGANNEEESQEEIAQEDKASGKLSVYSKGDKIYIESTLEHDTTVVIYSTSGQIVRRVHVKAMSSEVVRMPSRGIYIVNKQKVSVV